MEKAALYTAAVIFAAVSALHWVRVFNKTEIVIGDASLPLWVSLAAGVVFTGLVVWMVAAGRRL